MIDLLGRYAPWDRLTRRFASKLQAVNLGSLNRCPLLSYCGGIDAAESEFVAAWDPPLAALAIALGVSVELIYHAETNRFVQANRRRVINASSNDRALHALGLHVLKSAKEYSFG